MSWGVTMLRALRAALMALLVTSAALAAELKPYVNEDLASDAVRLAATLKTEAGKIGAQAAGRTPEDLRKAASAAVAAGKFDVAAKLAAAAVTAAPKDPANWLAYAWVAVKADDAQANNRWDLVTQGAAAAYAAYQHAGPPADQAVALAMLGDLLARHSTWRGALDAYKASLDRRDNLDVRKTYEAMRAQYGFRILDYKVDNESTNPRVCFNFSDPLARKTDFAPYVAVSGASSTAISNEDQQICVEGLKHGERYAIVLREGLPSAVGENLLKSADYEIYVRDRSPQAHFAGKAYVLPRQGQQGAPLVTVNTSKVAIDVYRIGDRNLIATVSRDDFLKPIDTSRAQEIADQDGVKVWSGSMDVAEHAQQGRRDRLSADEGGRQARSGRLSRHRAAVEGEARERGRDRIRSARDAMDGRLRPRPHRHFRRRRRACAGRVARHRRAARRRRTEARRPQQRGAGDQDDRRRRARRFRPRPVARQGRLGPGAARGDAERRLRFPQSDADRLRSHRPRRRRARRARPVSTPSSTPSAASTARARRCSRSRCCATPRASP